jgi:hypothetical protein
VGWAEKDVREAARANGSSDWLGCMLRGELTRLPGSPFYANFGIFNVGITHDAGYFDGSDFTLFLSGLTRLVRIWGTRLANHRN